MSSKNMLQEHYKNRTDLLKYNTMKIGGGDHNPIWKSELIIDKKKFTAEDKTKKGAELLVADKAYRFINKKDVSNEAARRAQKYKNVTDIDLRIYKKIVLIDGENQDVDMKYLSDKQTLFMIFVAKNTSKNLVFMAQEMHNNCCVFISECVGKDAADHMLTFYLGKLSILAPNKNYYVLTKDHYGEYLPHFCPNTKFICSIEEIAEN